MVKNADGRVFCALTAVAIAAVMMVLYLMGAGGNPRKYEIMCDGGLVAFAFAYFATRFVWIVIHIFNPRRDR